MMIFFEWFDAHCAWIYNNMCIFNAMFFGNAELPLPAAMLKCLLMAVWLFLIFAAPLFIVIRGVGYIIGGWIGALPAFFYRDDD